MPANKVLQDPEEIKRVCAIYQTIIAEEVGTLLKEFLSGGQSAEDNVNVLGILKTLVEQEKLLWVSRDDMNEYPLYRARQVE